MRILLSLLALFALFVSVNGQATTIAGNVAFPLTDLKVQITDVPVNDITGVKPPMPSNLNPTIIPSFTKFGQVELRYTAEVIADSPVFVRILWKSQDVFSTFTAAQKNSYSPALSPNTVTARACFSTLAKNPALSASKCTAAAVATTIVEGTPANTNGAGYTFYDSPHPTGSYEYFELQMWANVNGVPTKVSYIITFAVSASAASGSTAVGANLWSLDSAYGSNFSPSFISSTSQYTMDFAIQSVTATVNIPFYLATQISVTTVFVQECPGLRCDFCPISGAGAKPRLQLTTPGKTVSYADASFTSGATDSNSNQIGQNGEYRFPASTNFVSGRSENCVRFITQADAGTRGTNEQTFTVSLNITNCGAFSTCATCSGSVRRQCGWCLTDNFIPNSGSCRVGTELALTSVASDTYKSCTYNSAAPLAIPRFIQPGRVDLCTVVIKGDPRISGLQGQDFQVHGTPNEYFNLVTSSILQVNSRFVYLDDAQCDNFTACFSHPGTYIDEVGIMMGEDKVRLVAGSIKESSRVFINGKEVQVSNHKHTVGKISVTFANNRRILIKTPEFMMTVSQSDKFFNIESALLKTELLDQGSKLIKLESSRATEANTYMHGLIGQTWRNNLYAGNREYEGEVSDYQLQDGIWGTDFTFNLYKQN